MTIQQIKYVITIYETGQFSKSGEKLYVTQPSLSKAVRDLEDELGITIFERMIKGIIVTDEGEEFITYAREVYRQYELLYDKFKDPFSIKHRFGVSCQHYSFASKAFAETVGMLESSAEHSDSKFDFAFRETRTSEVIHDISTLRSEVGILFTADFNAKFIEKLLADNELVFTELLKCPVNVFLCRSSPLADKAVIRSEDLSGYPCVIYEQGSCEPYYLSEELVPVNDYDRVIKVTDKLTMLNLIADMNGFTFSTRINYNTLNGRDYVCVPFVLSDGSQPEIRIGSIVRKDHILSEIGDRYSTCPAKRRKPLEFAVTRSRFTVTLQGSYRHPIFFRHTPRSAR